MKTVLALGIGFFVGHRVSREYYKRQTQQKDRKLHDQIIAVMEDLGIGKREAQTNAKNLISK